MNEHDSMVAEIDRLQAENAALKADTQRLDWIQEQIAENKPLPEFVPAEFDGPYCTAGAGFQYGSTGGANLREAIDAAMKAAPSASSPPGERGAVG